MKKFLIFGALILSLGTLSACNQGVSEELEPVVQDDTNLNLTEPSTEDTLTEKTPDKVENTDTTTEIESDWVTYQNEAMGFEFTHPKNWIIDTGRSEGQTVVFIDENGAQGGETRESVMIVDNTEKLNLDEMVDKFMKERGYTEDIVSEYTASISESSTIKVKTNEFGLTYYFVLHPNTDQIFQIDTQGNLFNEEVLKSFKFIPA